MQWHVGLLLNTIMFLTAELQTGFVQFYKDSSASSALFVACGSIACSSSCSDCGGNFVSTGHVYASDAERVVQIGSMLQYVQSLAVRGLEQVSLILVALSVGAVLWHSSLVVSIKDGVCNVGLVLQNIKKLIMAERRRGTALCLMQRRLNRSVSVESLFLFMLKPAQALLVHAKDGNGVAKGR